MTTPLQQAPRILMLSLHGYVGAEPELGLPDNATSEVLVFRAPSLYHAEAPHAAGIREGLEHFGWLSSTDTTDGTTP